ncbi:MAG: SPW repeat protein [Xanthobacteraceae bacterium]
MAAVTFTPPKQWEDWCDWGLGIWLMLSPWVLLFEYDTPATRNAVIAGFLVVAAEALTLSMFQVWEEWINVALGAWLIVSPLGPGRHQRRREGKLHHHRTADRRACPVRGVGNGPKA